MEYRYSAHTVDQPVIQPMSQPSFPLFQPAREDPDEPVFMGLYDVIRHEVTRAALEGSDPDAITRVRFTIDLTDHIEQHLQALAYALGSSRRAMAAKLLTGAVLDTVNTLSQESRTDPESAAVFDVYCDSLAKLKQDAAA